MSSQAPSGPTLKYVLSHNEIASLLTPHLKHWTLSVQSCQPQLLKDGTVRIVSGNALGDVLQDEQEPFDAIHVGAAAATMPETLLMKLAPGGRMVRQR